MDITEVRVALREAGWRVGHREERGGERRLKAYATITFDQCFVVRNIKVIEGRHGLFVAMPSRKPRLTCPGCQFKVDVGGRYCVQCGTSLPRIVEPSPGGDAEAPEAQAHRDIAHPITAAFRHYLQQRVLEAYDQERARAQGAGPSEGDERSERDVGGGE